MTGRMVNSVVRSHEIRSAISSKGLLVSLAEEDGDLPVHERLYRRIRSLIQSGVMMRGARLASSRALADHLGISRNSVLAAVDRLIADGWLEAHRGAGVYISYSGPSVARETIPRPRDALGSPLDLFPTSLWKQLQSRRWATISSFDLQFGDALGWPALRQAIAAQVGLARGLACSPDQVLVTTSVPAAIDLALRALALTGADVWVEDPSYHASRQALENCGVRMVPIPVDDFGMDVEFARRETPGARAALVTPACQFPTCVSMSNSRRERLLRWAAESEAWILEDDYDWQSGDRKQLPLPLAAREPSRTIYIDSFNPVLFPALRIAFMICPAALIDRFAAVRVGLDQHSNAPNQMILADFIEGGHLDRHLSRLASAYPERRAVLLDCLERELSDVLEPHRRSIGTHAVATLRACGEDEFVSACFSEHIAVEGMQPYRMCKTPRQDVLFGYAGFTVGEIRDAAAAMRRAATALAGSRHPHGPGSAPLR